MDGVIVDTQSSVTGFWNELAAEFGVTISREQFIRHIYGCPADHTLRYVFPSLDSAQRRVVMDHMAEYETNELTYNAILGIIDFPASLIAGVLWQGVGAWTGFGPSAPFLFGAAMALLALVMFILWKPQTGEVSA